MRFWIQIMINIVIVVVVVVSLVVVINRDCATEQQVQGVEDKVDEIETKLDNYLPKMWAEIQNIEGKLDDYLPKMWAEIQNIEKKLDEPTPEERQVKVKQIPIPWQFWATISGGVRDIIQLSDTYCQPVLISREFATLPQVIELEDLTWEETEMMVIELAGGWRGYDLEPVLLNPGDELAVNIQTEPGMDVEFPTEEIVAVVVRYTVALASAPDEIVARVVNEAMLASESPQVIIGQLTNFEVHNDTCVEVDNFELELYGIQISDILGWYDEAGGYHWETRPWGPTLYGGWGTPPYIALLPDGAVEVKWKAPDYPIKSCQWVHFGLYIRPGVDPVGVQAFWTILVD